MSHDVVIVGGGSAGCALAARLSEDRSTRVLLLEAGRPDWWWDIFVHMPAALRFTIGSPLYDWRYQTDPEPFMDGRRLSHARGKLWGGSSSINGMIFQRGNPLDYEKWAALPGLERWDYAHCLPYFKRMESCLAGADAWRGGSGPLIVERSPARGPLFDAFFAAAQQAGHDLTEDVNGYRQEGFGRFDRTIHRGRRVSAARAYLHPALPRKNLDVRSWRLVTRVLFHRSRAVGVEARHGRSTETFRAGEVILCGGAINSPQLLQLSGVGEPEHLRSLGIRVVADLPGVGGNLQDHLKVYVQHACAQPVSAQPALKRRNHLRVGAEWLLRRTGPGATNHFEAGGFACSNDEVDYPNLMLHFLPLAVDYDGSASAGEHGYQVIIGPRTSDARGSVRIVSADPWRHPSLRFNYLSTEQDRREWVEAIRCARKILSQPAWAGLDAGELAPGPRVQTDEDVIAWVARQADTGLHPSCTCAMGVGPDSVVDPASMQVHGTQRLRVVDASVFPSITNANIYAPTMMVAERAADVIRGLTELAPQETEYHRRGDAMADRPARPDTAAA